MIVVAIVLVLMTAWIFILKQTSVCKSLLRKKLNLRMTASIVFYRTGDVKLYIFHNAGTE